MALDSLSTYRPIVAFGTVSFFMNDNDKIIRIDVGQDLLAKIDNGAPASRADYIDRCERHKRFFTRLATLKYHAGKYEPEVNVLVVRIDEDDLS